MMKLASVSFNCNPEQIGGGHVPAIAFKEWCIFLGHECTLINGNHVPDESYYDKFDGVFFATPPKKGYCVPSKIPYVVMIHAEFDSYDDTIMDGAKAVAVIDQKLNYWKFKNQKYWHPCCSPRHLLTGAEVFRKRKGGLLYAARVSTWKNANTLMALSNINDFQLMYGPISIYGKANNNEFGKLVNGAKSLLVNRVDSLFNPDDLNYSEYEFFWDVSGTNEYKIKIPRLNLAAFEAMKHGCIPIVDKNAIPESLWNCVIDIGDLFNNVDLNEIRNNIIDGAKFKYYGFNHVRNQVEEIIKEFK